MTEQYRAPKLAIVGSNMVDLVTYISRMPNRGETVEAPEFEIGCGGKGANQAVAAALLGSAVIMVSKVGDDMFGQNTKDNLARFGIDIRHVSTVEGSSSGVAPIFVEPNGENTILIVKGANKALSPADVDAAEADLREAGLILLQTEIPLETVRHTIRRANEWGVVTLLNPAPVPEAMRLKDLAGLGYLIPNESELALLSGLPTETEADIETAARYLITCGIDRVLVTLGGRGARLFTQNEVQAIPAISVTPVDTTGAGDAFIGAFAHHLASGFAPQAAMQHAALYAANSVTKRGTQKSYATAVEFADFAARHLEVPYV